MSHYAILVIGENIEEQLAPYDENLEVPRYVKYTKESLIEHEKNNIENYKKSTYTEYLMDKKKYKSNCKNDAHINYLENEFPLKLKWTDEEIYRDAIKYYDENEIGENGEIYSEYNPNSKWDWYQIGGRYAGRLLLKNGTAYEKPNFSWEWHAEEIEKVLKENRTDSALKKDIDFEKIHQSKESYDKAIRFWEIKIEGKPPKTQEEIDDIKYDYYSKDYYLNRYKDKETYAKCISNFTIWGFIKDGKWYEKGEMGWWGMSSESHEDAVKWELNFFDDVIKPLPEDTLLTIVDCHI